jgi:hypothetical protein
MLSRLCRKLLCLSFAVFAIACDDPQPQHTVVTTAPRETVLVHDRSTGNDLLMLCAVGIICNNGPVLQTYSIYHPAPAYITHIYSPASPTFYRTAPTYRAPVYRSPVVAAPTRSVPNYARPSAAPARVPSYSRPPSIRVRR